jgi:hypothetical protein
MVEAIDQVQALRREIIRQPLVHHHVPTPQQVRMAILPLPAMQVVRQASQYNRRTETMKMQGTALNNFKMVAHSRWGQPVHSVSSVRL